MPIGPYPKKMSINSMQNLSEQFSNTKPTLITNGTQMTFEAKHGTEKEGLTYSVIPGYKYASLARNPPHTKKDLEEINNEEVHKIHSRNILDNGVIYTQNELNTSIHMSYHAPLSIFDHYKKHPSGMECIDLVKHENFNIGNAFKYLWRRKLKGDEIGDLKKAVYYINNEIMLLENSKK